MNLIISADFFVCSDIFFTACLYSIIGELNL